MTDPDALSRQELAALRVIDAHNLRRTAAGYAGRAGRPFVSVLFASKLVALGLARHVLGDLDREIASTMAGKHTLSVADYRQEERQRA